MQGEAVASVAAGLARWEGGAVHATSAALHDFEDANLVVQTLPAGARKVVQRGGYYGRYVPSGHLVYIHEGTLFAAPFDLDRLEVDRPVRARLGRRVRRPRVSRRGAVRGGRQRHAGVSAAEQSDQAAAPIVWMDREGKMTRCGPRLQTGRTHASRRTAGSSPCPSATGQSDVWVYDWARDMLSRFTFDSADDHVRCGRRTAAGSRLPRLEADKSTLNLYWQRADGTGEVQRLTESKNNQYPTSWHPSGKFLAFDEANPQTGKDS